MIFSGRWNLTLNKNMKPIRDKRGRLIGQIIDNGNVSNIRDAKGKLKGQHIKSSDVTLDGNGRYYGKGDQLLRLVN